MKDYDVLLSLVPSVKTQIELELIQIINEPLRFETFNQQYLEIYKEVFEVEAENLIISWWYDGNGVIPFFLNFQEKIYVCFVFDSEVNFLFLFIVEVKNIEDQRLSFHLIGDPGRVEVEFIPKDQQMETIERKRIKLYTGSNTIFFSSEDLEFHAFRFLVFSGPRPLTKKILQFLKKPIWPRN